MEDIGLNVRRYMEAAVRLSSLPEDTEEWNDQADSMDLLWNAMTAEEQDVVRRLLSGE